MRTTNKSILDKVQGYPEDVKRLMEQALHLAQKHGPGYEKRIAEELVGFLRSLCKGK